MQKYNINVVGVTEAIEVLTDGELIGIVLGVLVVLVIGVTASALLVLWSVDVLLQ